MISHWDVLSEHTCVCTHVRARMCRVRVCACTRTGVHQCQLPWTACVWGRRQGPRGAQHLASPRTDPNSVFQKLGSLNTEPALPSTSYLPATPSVVPASSYVPSSETPPGERAQAHQVDGVPGSACPRLLPSTHLAVTPAHMVLPGPSGHSPAGAGRPPGWHGLKEQTQFSPALPFLGKTGSCSLCM